MTRTALGAKRDGPGIFNRPCAGRFVISIDSRYLGPCSSAKRNQDARSREHGVTAIPSGAIDCDVHPAVPGTAALLPYLDEYWTDTVTMILRGIAQLELNSHPPNAPLSPRPDWRPKQGRAGSTVEMLRSQALDPFGL